MTSTRSGVHEKGAVAASKNGFQALSTASRPRRAVLPSGPPEKTASAETNEENAVKSRFAIESAKARSALPTVSLTEPDGDCARSRTAAVPSAAAAPASSERRSIMMILHASSFAAAGVNVTVFVLLPVMLPHRKRETLREAVPRSKSGPDDRRRRMDHHRLRS